MITIRLVRSGESELLRDIEWLAGEQFRDVGFPSVADDEPASVETLEGYIAEGRAWAAANDADTPVGYCLVDDMDGNAHIEQVSVRPDHQGRGIGRALVDQARAWATETGRPAVTLTTFTNVPWNRPLYEHLGFRVLTDSEIGPQLRALRAEEAIHGLDPAIRVCMRLECLSVSEVVDMVASPGGPLDRRSVHCRSA